MAVNKPTGDDARKGAVKQRTRLLDQRQALAKKKYKGVRKEW
jgi:hypothetical protein